MDAAWRFTLLVIALAATGPARGETLFAYCASETGSAVVYFSAGFDTLLNPVEEIQREFDEYLVGRYGYATNSNYPVSCINQGATLAGIEAQMGDFEASQRKAGKQVIETGWTYVADPAAAVPSQHRLSASPAPPADHGYCLSQPFDRPLYVSATFDATPPVNISEWNAAFMRFLGGKYGFKGNAYCRNASLGDARRLVKARTDGARAASRSIVDTGWKYDAASASAPPVAATAAPATATAAAQAPAAHPAQAQEFAASERKASLARCVHDRLLNGPFDCPRMQHAVYEYRLAHWSAGATPEPLEQLLTGDRLDCSTCIGNASTWGHGWAESHGLKPGRATCVGQHFADGLKAKPYPNRVQEVYDASVKACPAG